MKYYVYRHLDVDRPVWATSTTGACAARAK